MKVGTLKWYNVGKGYGFIIPADGSEDVFFHKTSVQTLHGVQRIIDCGRNNSPIKLKYELNTSAPRVQAKSVDVV